LILKLSNSKVLRIIFVPGAEFIPPSGAQDYLILALSAQKFSKFIRRSGQTSSRKSKIDILKSVCALVALSARPKWLETTKKAAQGGSENILNIDLE